MVGSIESVTLSDEGGQGERARSRLIVLSRIAGSIPGWQWRPDLADLRAYGSSGSTPSLVLRRRCYVVGCRSSCSAGTSRAPCGPD